MRIGNPHYPLNSIVLHNRWQHQYKVLIWFRSVGTGHRRFRWQTTGSFSSKRRLLQKCWTFRFIRFATSCDLVRCRAFGSTRAVTADWSAFSSPRCVNSHSSRTSAASQVAESRRGRCAIARSNEPTVKLVTDPPRICKSVSIQDGQVTIISILPGRLVERSAATHGQHV